LADGSAVLARTLAQARWNIFWERLWPTLALVATVVGLFLTVSWLGLWLWLPPLGRAAGTILFAAAFAASLWPLARVRFPSAEEALRRVDSVSGIAHRPATTIADRLATPGDDPLSAALWRAHVERALAAARALTAGKPSPQLALRDPVAVRALVLMLVLVTFVAAGGERFRRIAMAFDWHGVVVPPDFRLDAWVSPPNYTGKPPVILPGIHPGEATQASRAAIAVPSGSILVVRASGSVKVDVATTGGLAETKDGASPQGQAGSEEFRYTITDKGSATVRGVGNDVVWNFTAIPDAPPSIELVKDPEPQARGALLLTYKIEDDYGVTDAQAKLSANPEAAAGADAPRPLYGAPDVQLVLPQSRAKSGVGQTTKDLTEHPWAGAEVQMTLVARDEAGNEGKSAVTEFRLPQRAFSKPLARALIEQRRTLALDAEARDRVLIALDALAIAPERFIPETGIYLGLRSIYWNLAQAKTDDQLREVVQRLWAMATQIEDGNVSQTERDLRAAQEALRQALERGASDEEIKKLMQDLRAALDKFLQALAEEMRKNPQQAQRMDPSARPLRSQDLKSMLDKLEQLSRSGAKDAARQLLEQLQQMLENLQMARPGGDMDNGDDDMMSALDELGDVIRKQQELRDRTFRQGQDQRRERGQRFQNGPRQGQQGEQGDNGEQQFGELKQGQQALREQLKKLLEELKKKGLGQNGPGEQGQDLDDLGRAGDAMGDAEGALGEGNADSAVDGQGKALEALRKGAQNLAQALQQQMGQGPGPGQPGRNGPARAQQDTDPLGRPLRGRDYGDDVTVKVPGEIDVQRARRILEELRRRLGEATRPQQELDYIERLLKDF
jgi:uncharacterized protein (TIGR02302 family)